jgi:hypothetical protein
VPDESTNVDKWGQRVLLGMVMLFATVACGAVVAKAVAPMDDPDTPWQLVMGHKFLSGTSLRHPGPMSPLGTEDWRPRDWAVQMVMAQFDSWFGLPGVAWLFGAAIVALTIVQYRNCRRRAGVTAALLATTLGIVAGHNGYSARPQMVSFILLAITLGAVLDTEGDLKPRWWLIPLTGVWALCHGLWFLCVVLQVTLLVGLLLDRRLTWRLGWRLGLCGLGSLVAVAVTPNGLYELTHPTGQTAVGVGFILEYAAPSRQSPSFVMWLLLLTVIVLSWLRRGLRPSWVELLIVLLAALMALEYLRTIILGTILITPLLASALEPWVSAIRVQIRPGVERGLMLGVGGLALAVLALAVPSSAQGVSSTRFPTSFDTTLDALPSRAVLFNELGDGGYLAWRHPGLRIVGDGLSDQYAASWLSDWFGALDADPGWCEFLNRTGATWALLKNGSRLTAELEEARWAVEQERQGRVLLHRSGTTLAGCNS